MFKTGVFVDKNVVSNCSNDIKTNLKLKKLFWGYENITANKIYCITFHGSTFNLKKNLNPDVHR